MGIKVLVTNRKASHDYELMDRLEAGISLVGTEVKALRAGKANLTDGWVDVEQGEAILRDISIGHYSHGNQMNHQETRPRKLLLKKREIKKLQQKINEKGLTVIPIKLYFKEQFIKVEIALAKGKKLHDKRESEKTRDANREIHRAIRRKN